MWPAKHSQIYPLLNKMEQEEFLEYEHVEQIGKPDKKIYSITEKGKEALEDWIAVSPSDPINRDEFLIKVYSIWLLKEEDSVKLIQDRIKNLEKTIDTQLNKMAELENKESDSMSKNFGRYILIDRKFRLAKEEKKWCQKVLNLIKDKKFNFPFLCYVSVEGINGAALLI
ncbi:hypothetical protein CHCC5027_2464 [Bacillus paralicheniformis]|nr:hypothetical protein CHCC5027_2464 [Bacillus paralicheniformis]